jgi:hypothetical protein
MNGKRLAEIEEAALTFNEDCIVPKDIMLDLIAALRAERQSFEIVIYLNGLLQDSLESERQQKDNKNKLLEAERQKVVELEKELDKFTVPRPIEDIHEDYGDVFLWNLPVSYAPDVGGCLNCDFDETLYTHFTLIPNIKDPIDGK